MTAVYLAVALGGALLLAGTPLFPLVAAVLVAAIAYHLWTAKPAPVA